MRGQLLAGRIVATQVEAARKAYEEVGIAARAAYKKELSIAQKALTAALRKFLENSNGR